MNMVELLPAVAGSGSAHWDPRPELADYAPLSSGSVKPEDLLWRTDRAEHPGIKATFRRRSS